MDSVGGTFVLTAKKEKSLDYREVVEVLAKKQKPKWVEISVVGELAREKEQMVIKAHVTGERFFLKAEAPPKEAKKADPFQKLEASVQAGKKVTGVTGKVEEPKSEKGKPKQPVTLLVTGFETAEK